MCNPRVYNPRVSGPKIVNSRITTVNDLSSHDKLSEVSQGEHEDPKIDYFDSLIISFLVFLVD
jgi:hypothetical protein